MPVHHPALYHSKDIILESKRELPDENENTEVTLTPKGLRLLRVYLGRYWLWVWIWKWRSWIWRRGTSKSSKGNATVGRDFGKITYFPDRLWKNILDKNPCPKSKTISRSGFISSNFNTENTQNKSFASWYARGKSCRVLLGFCTSSVSKRWPKFGSKISI